MATKNQAEQSLSDLSMTELGDRLPGLLPYLLGFELITSNDEKTRAAGILGFDIGGERVLIPCLFLNGRIRGMEMMYMSDTDTFVSATPQLVEYLTSRSTGVTGAPDPAGDRTGTVPSAALRIFNREPQITKRAGLDMFEKFIDLEKALSDTSSTFISVLKSMGKKAYLQFMTDVTENYPELFSKIAEYYDVNELSKIAGGYPNDADGATFADVNRNNLPSASGPKPMPANVSPLATPTPAATPERPVKPVGGGLGTHAHSNDMNDTANPLKGTAEYMKSGGLSFITHKHLEANPEAFDEKTKIAVMREGMVVMDKRAADEKSELFTDDYAKSFSTPIDTSFYSLINVYGNMKEVLVAHYPFNPMYPSKNSTRDIIINLENNIVRTTRETEQFLVRSKKNDCKEEFDAFHDKLPTIASAKIGKQYMLVNKKRLISVPFNVENRVIEDGKTALSITVDNWQYGLDICRGTPGHPNDYSYPHKHTLLVVDSEGQKTHSFGPTVGVCKDWRILEIKTRPSYDAPEGQRSKYDNEVDQLRPATSRLITEVIQGKGILDLNVLKKQGKYIIRNQGVISRPHTKLGALQILTAYVGLDANEAKSILDGLTSNGMESKTWVKRAAIYTGMDFPDTDQSQGVNEMGIMEQAPFYQAQQVPLNNPPVPDDWNLDAGNYDKIKKNDVDFLMRAADTNSKAVFDPAMIGVLLKTNRTQIQVDQWVPDLVGALDKLCRLLLLFYWKNSDFAESYGNDDLSELEDVLLNNIKNLGTVVLFLKQRTSETSGTKIDAFSGNQ